MFTADTITDAQIQRVRRAMVGHPNKTAYHRSIIADCDAALAGNTAHRASAAVVYNEMLGASLVPKLTRCPGRGHRDHVADVCIGSCCTSCGGPIDENEECRC